MKIWGLFLFLSFFINSGVKAQKYFPFPTGNVKWNVYLLSTCEEDKPPDTFLLRYSIHGDTTINCIGYKKLCLEHGDTSHPVIEAVGGIREFDKKIFYAGKNYLGMSNNSEWLLYDFNKQIGDSFIRDEFGYLITKILDIDSIKIGEEYRKRYKVDNNWFYHNPDYIIEGIGNVLDGLLGHITFIPTCGIHYWELMCFYNNGQLLYQNPSFNDCYPARLIVSVKNKPELQELKIYPNPFSNEFHVDYIPTDQIYTIKMYDVIGRLVFQQNLTTNNNRIFFQFNNGLYSILIIGKNGEIYKSSKIIKN
jgi:hypothetical protein